LILFFILFSNVFIQAAPIIAAENEGEIKNTNDFIQKTFANVDYMN